MKRIEIITYSRSTGDIRHSHQTYTTTGAKDANGNYRKFQGRKERDPKTRAKTFPGIATAMAEQWDSL